MLKKDFGLSVKDVSDSGTIEGYGSVFGGAPDSYGDIVRPGAFADSLARHLREGTMPLMLWGHNSSEVPIGNWTEMAEDGKGLYVKGTIDLEDSLGERVHRALKQRRMRGLSIGYETIGSETDKKQPGIRYLTKLDLWEVSPVNFPAKRNALVQDVKSILDAGNLPSLPEFESFLREAGFSKTQAAAIANRGLSHLLRSESEGEKAKELAAFLQKLRS